MRRRLTALLAILAVVAVIVAGMPGAAAAPGPTDSGTTGSSSPTAPTGSGTPAGPAGAPAPECTVKWYGSAGTPNWHDAANWNTGALPGDSDVVCVEDGYYVVHSVGATIVANLQVAGNLTLVGGSLAAYGASNVFELDVAGGTLFAGGELTVTHDLAWTGGTIGGQGALIVAPGAKGAMFDPGTKTLTGLLRNDGDLTWSGGSLQMATGFDPHLDNHGSFAMSGAVTTSPSMGEDLPRFTNRPGATITKTGSGEAVLGDQRATLVNDGTVTVSGGTLWIDMWLDGFGGADLNSGAWAVAGGATLKLHAADLLSTNSADISLLGLGAGFQDGSGNDALDGLATNAGSLTLSGGRDLAVSGQFANDGTLRLGAGSELSVAEDFYAGNGRLEVGIAGTAAGAYGRVSAAGTAWLGGTLAPELADPFEPGSDDSFEVLTAAALSGSIASVEGAMYVNYDRAGGRVLLTATDPFPGCTTVFGGGSSFWSDPNNWSAGEVPSGDDTACIPEGMTAQHYSGASVVNALQGAGRLEILGGSISVTGESSLAELGLAGGTLTGDGQVTVMERFDWTGGALAGVGTLAVAGSATAEIAGAGDKTLGRHLRNDGSFTWSAGTIRTSSSGDLHPHLDNYGTITISGAVSTDLVSGTPPLFTNRPGATIVKTGSWMTTATFSGGDFSNEGTVRVENGATLAIDATVAQISGTTLTGGKWEVVEGTLMVKDLSVVTNQAEIVMWGCCNLIVDETYNDAITGTLVVNEGILSLHHKSLGVSPGFGNSGTIRLDPWSRINAPDGFSQSATGRLVTEISGVEPDGSNGAVETNLAALDGVIESVLVPSDGEEQPYEPGPGDEFTVVDADALLGTFSSVEGPLPAAYDYEAGDVILSLGGSTGECTVNWDGGALTTSWHDAANWSPDGLPGPSDVVCIPAGITVVHSSWITTTVSAIASEGGLDLAGGTLEITDESTIGTFDLGTNGSTFTGAGNLTVDNVFTWTQGTLAGAGVLTVAAAATGSISGANAKILDRHLVNEGELTWSDGLIVLHGLAGGGLLDNAGTFTISGDDSALWYDGGTTPKITNRAGATILKTGTATATLGGSGVEFTNDGTVWVTGGTLRLDGDLAGLSGTTLTGGTWNIDDGAILRVRNASIVTNAAEIALLGPNADFQDHTGTPALSFLAVNDGELSLQDWNLALPNDLTNNGVLTLRSTEVYVLGAFTQSAGGRLEVAVSGTVPNVDYGRVVAWGGATIGGTLFSDLIGGYTPGPGDTFAVIDAASLTGTFATVEGDLAVSYDVPNGDVILGAGAAGDCNVDWDGGAATTSWHDAANWNPDTLPGPSDVACIPAGVTVVYSSGGATTVSAVSGEGALDLVFGSLSIADESQIDTLIVGGGGTFTGAGNMTVTNAFTWTAGELSGLGTLTVASGASGSLSGGAGKWLGRHVRNDGSLVWSDGPLYMRSDGDRDPHLDNYGTFTISGDDITSRQQGTAVPRITNRSGASIVKTGAGTATLGDGGTEFVNDGTVTSVEGTLRVGGGAASGGSGTWGLLGGNVTFDAGTWELTGDVSGIGTVTVPSGTMRMSGSARYAVLGTVISGGTLDLDNTPVLGNVATDLEVSWGILTGDGDLLVNEQFTWTGGELTGLGTLTVDCAEAPLCSLSGSGQKWLGRHLRNDGSLVWSDGMLLMRSDGDRDPHLDNYGTFTISGDDITSRQQGTAVPRITNRSGASIVKTGAGTATLGDGGTEFVNDGTVTSVEGTLRVGGGAASGGSGTWDLLGGNVTFHTGTWELTGDVSGIGTVTVPFGTTVRMSSSARYAVLGTVISGGALDLDNTPAVANVATDLTVSSGILTGDGDLLVNEQFTWTGGELTGLGTLTLDCAEAPLCSIEGAGGKWLGRHVRNDGSLVWSDGPIFMRSDGDRDPHLDNYGTFTISGDDITSRQQGTAVPRITNRSGASIVKTGAGTATLGDGGTEFVNDGTVTSVEGTLRVGGGAASGGSGTWGLLGGNVTFHTGTWELTGDVSGIGTVTVSGGTVRMSGSARWGTVTDTVVSGGTLDLDNTPAIENLTNSLTVSSGVLTGDGDLLVDDLFSWTGGELTGLGTLTVASGASGSLSGPGGMWLGRHVRNDGSLAWSDGPLYMRSDGDRDPHLDNYGTFTISGDDVTSRQQGTAVPRITNRSGASIVKTGAAGATFGDSGTEFVNDGTVWASAGTLRLNGTLVGLTGTTLTGGTWNVADGATLRVNNANVVTNAADIGLLGPNAAFEDYTGANALRNLAVNDGELSLQGKDLSLGGDLTNNGTLALGPASAVALVGDYHQSVSGRLQIGVSGTTPGTGFGRVLVSGAASVDGTIGSTFVGGYVPAPTDEILVIDAATLTGSFSAVEGGLLVRYERAAGDVVLEAEDADPVPPVVTLEAQSGFESADTFLVEVMGIGGNTPVTLPVQVFAGTATEPEDYTTAFTPTTVTVLPDATSYVPVTLFDDALDEDDETFTVHVGGSAATMTLLDDDAPPVAVIDDFTMTEGDEGHADAAIPVRLVDPYLRLLPQPSGRDITVAATTTDGTATAPADYLDSGEILSFGPGQTDQNFTVLIAGDEVEESEESFTVALDEGTNVTVADGESGTVTIVDNDGSGGGDGIAQELETGGAALFDLLDDWGDAYDLDRSGPSPFELPGLTDELASLYEPQDELDALDSPFSGLDDDLNALCGQLEARGLAIDWVEGGACGYPAPPTDEDVIQVRYTVRLSDLAEALGFTGDEFNDDAEGILDGLVADLGLDADFDSNADLIVTLVVGVDESGFYVSDESGLRLEVDATATASGTGDVGGIDGLDIEGPASVDVAVELAANGGPARLRVADLAAPPASYLRPAAEGTVDLHLDATLGPLSLSWDSTFALAVDADFSTDITVDARLEGTLTLPGLTEDGQPATIEMVGTFDGTTWTLTGEGASGAEYALDGFDVDELGFTVVLAPDVFDGSASLSLQTDLGGPETPLTLDCDAAFDHAAVHTECHLSLDEANIGLIPVLAHLHGVTVDGVFDADIGTGDMTGGIEVAAATLVVLPQPAPPGQVPEGAARAEDVTGSLDSDGNLALHAGLLTGSIGGKIDFSAADVDFSLGPDATGPVFSVDTVTATIPSLNGLGVTFSGFHLNRDGTFGAESIDVASQGFLQTIGLAGILPFDITEVEVTFPDHENLDTFDVTVAGHFDFTAMAGLPFTPVVGLGGAPVRPSSPPEENHFSFTVAVDSLGEGRVRPKDLGPITLGFDDLHVGDVTLGAQLTLGGYQDGEWVDDFGGQLSILGGVDVVAGAATIDVTGSLDVTPTTAALDLAGTFSVSAALGDDVTIEGASLDFALGVSVDADFGITLTGPTFGGAGIDRVAIAFGDFMRLVGTGVRIDFAPAPGDPLVAFGGTPCDDEHPPPCGGSLAVEFDEEIEVLSGWGGEAGNFGIAADFTPMLLPGFFLNITVPPGFGFGLPDWLPLRVDEVGIRFPDVDFENIPDGGLQIADLAAFAIRFSGGIEAVPGIWPISAAVDGLEVDLGKLVRGEFPITNLDGFKMGVEPFELVPGFKIGGGLELKTMEVDGDPAEGEQIEEVFYGRIFGQFEYEGFGAGIDLVVTQYGPVLAKVLVPVGVPIDGGLLGGVILSGVEGGLKFGGPAFPDPDSPLDILHDPAFDTDFPVDDDTIRDSVEPAVQQENFTWDSGFTLALSGKLTHAMAPAIVSGDVTIGMNVGLIPGQQGVKFIGSGDISVWGMEFAGAALLIDLQEPLEPKFDFAFETPQPGNPLGFLLPAQAQLTASLDTTGIIPGFALGVATFVERAVSGSLEVGQDFFDAALGALATSLEGDHTRPLARLLLDTNGDGLVSGGEDQQVITRGFLTSRALAVMGGGGLPSDPAAAGRAARMFVADLLSAGQDLLDDFDLSAVFTHADYAAFAELLGAGGESIAALFGVVRDAVREAGEAFLSQFDPSFHLKGMLQPVILGIPFGEPQHQVEVIISKTGLGFGFDTSIGDIGMQLCDRIIPVISGAFCRLTTLGFEDHLGMTFELPLGGIVDGLFGGSGVPTIDPWSGDWAIELRGGLRWLDFEVGQMTGLVVAADNPAFVDAHVQKLYENPGAPIDPTRIPIQTEAHYLDIVEYGGILLTGRLLLPELLTDPVGLLSAFDIEAPEDILDMPRWVSEVADHLSRIAQPAAVQLFIPGFGEVFEYAFDAATEAERISPIGSGRRLARAFNDISAAVYVEGTYDGTLLSVPFGKAVVTSGDQKLQVRGELPLIGVEATFDLDVKPTLGTDGMVDLPRAMATVTIDESDVDDVLARFGLPPLISNVAGVDATFRAVSPGYDPSSADRLLRVGGIEISSRLRIAGILNNARYRLSLSPNGDMVASASVGSFTPVPGITLTDGAVGFSNTAGVFAGTLGGTVRLDDWLAAALGVETVAVQGTFDTAGHVSLSFTIDGVTYDLVALANATVDQIVDFLVGLGRSFVEIAGILYENVTQSVTMIVDQLVRIGADFVELAEALFTEVTQNISTIVNQLVRIGADFVELAEALFSEVTQNVRTIVDQLVRKGADFVELAEALFTEVTQNLQTLVSQLLRKGASITDLAAALDTATGFSDAEIIDAIDDFTSATLAQLVDALEAMGRTTLSQLINMLEAIGYSDFADLAAALDAAATAFTDAEIINAIDDFTTASLSELVDALQAMGRTALGTIIDMLEAIGYTDIRDLAEALDDATSASYRQIAEALDDFTSASFNAIGDALRQAGASFATVVDALDWATNASVNQIADAIRYAGASFTQVMQALEDELRVNRYDTAAQLQRLGASIFQILDALVAVYNAGFNSLVNVLVSLGVALADATAAVTEFLWG